MKNKKDIKKKTENLKKQIIINELIDELKEILIRLDGLIK